MLAIRAVIRGWRAACRFCAGQNELYERWLLANRPWEEDLLHWAGESLHGRVPPPADRRTRSVTSTGWCRGIRRTPATP